MRVLSVFCALILIAVTTHAAGQTRIDEIIQSPNDKRSYRALELGNALTVLLISDPTADKAAAAMDVNVGSANDPDSFHGLAHFLEHMLFLGTEKYPEADAYQRYIRDHGGSHNAFTSLEHTNYFFDINADFLEGALDWFAEQFTHPLFNAEYVSREVNAVHSEFSSKIKDDGRRLYSALKQTLADGHPYGTFSVGNLETLMHQGEDKLRQELLDFYKNHYSANRMKLVVLGKESLDKLEKWVRQRFADIPNAQLEGQKIKQPFFGEDFLPAQIKVQSVMDKRSMMVAFPVPSAMAHRQSGPLNYIANLIGHEGEGSLLSALKQERLVNSLSAGSQFDTHHHALFSISMRLTEKGLENTDRILELLFAYIELIEKQGIDRIYFDEMAKMREIGFAFQEKSEPVHYVSALSTALQDTEPKRVLFEGYDLSQYRPELYREYLDYLHPENMLVALNAKSLAGDKLTPWYEAPYSISKLEQDELTQPGETNIETALAMPSPNPFIPENVSLLTGNVSEKPVRLHQEAGLQLWHATDTGFGTPKANLFLTIRSPHAMETADTLNKTELMVALFKDMINEFSYPAYLAGLNYELYNHMRGITIKISGYDNKQSLLLNKLLATLKHGLLPKDRFVIAKERLNRQLLNAKEKKPYEQSIAEAQRQLLTPSWNEEERLAALKTTGLEALQDFRENFFKDLDLAVLSTGNITEATSLNIAKQISAMLLKSANKTSVERASVTDLGGEQPWYRTLTVDHPDTGFVYYLQGQDTGFKERAGFMLLSQAIATDYYNQLRTEKQLGYVVFATNFSILEVPALAFIVQSPKAGGQEILAETKAFLVAERERLAKLPNTAFKRYQQALISRLTEQDNTLYQRSNRYWQDLDSKNFDFDTREKLVREVSAYDQQALLEIFDQATLTAGKQLLVYTVKPEQTDAKIEGWQALTDQAKQSLPFFQ